MFANGKEPSEAGAKSAESSIRISAPTLSLPKGGGAIRGIGEKFAANPVTGTGSLTVPLFPSPGRGGFGPELALAYDSGAGNGPFGCGWSLSLPSITRRTDKGLPRYWDDDESDVFILSGAEDLVPVLDASGQRARTTRILYGRPYMIFAYRPRVEGLFARIERWVAMDTGLSHWHSISRDNVTTLYGFDPMSCVADPDDPRRIFSYHICRSWDDKGNIVLYEYLPENGTGVDYAQAHEAQRTDAVRATQRYLKTIRYGNAQPYFPAWAADGAETPLPTNWLFEIVLDYGDHALDVPIPTPDRAWPVRPDPFSTYRAGFEVRTYRRVERVLAFHHFPNENEVGANCLVNSTDLAYSDQRAPTDPRNPIYTFLVSVTRTGYRRQGNGYLRASLPPLEFEYSQPQIQPDILMLDAESLANLPEGLDGSRYQWVDLDGEGLSGILADVGGAWHYKRNLSPLNQATLPDGDQAARARFGPQESVALLPSRSALGGAQHLLDLSGGGQLDVVIFNPPAPGFFKRTSNEQWEPFQAFASLPHVDWTGPNLTFVDLTGDGLADILITEDGLFTMYPSLGEAGFGPAEQVQTPWDEERGPKLVLADGTQSIFLADMSGDGLSDLVQARNGELCYWPNLGYGRFGPRVVMDGAPRFAPDDLFDPRRLRFADIDGSGTTDVLYVGADGVQVCFNQSGNAWASPIQIAVFPTEDSLSTVQVIDLLGTGTACLVWSSPLPGESAMPLRYVDLMGGQKPHLLVRTRNNLGAETRTTYAPSTRFYLADKLAGRPWITRLPHLVHVVERVETYDYISRNRFVTRYAYHHGYYDGFEREFRGFGMVEQLDTEELAVLSATNGFPPATNEDAPSHVPPVLTRTWFHTGIFLDGQRVSRHFEEEYYREPDLSQAQMEAILLDDTVLPDTFLLPDGTRRPFTLSASEAREACRALKGSILRQEIYALDGTEAQSSPYSISERNYTIELLQQQGPNRHAVFFTHVRETIDMHYERALFAVNGQQLADPRVSHALTLAVDPFGNVLQSVTIAYGRRYDDPDPLLMDDDRQKQKKILLTCTENQYTNAIQQDDAYRAPLPCDMRMYELIHVTPEANQPQVTNLFRFAELPGKIQAASDGLHDLPYEDIDASGATTSAPYRRLLEHSRSLYRRDDLSGALPLGTVESLALPFEQYKLALTPGLLTNVYQRQSASGTEALLPNPVSVLGGEGGYARSNDLIADGRFPASDPAEHWWLPSGRIFYSPGTGDTSAQELAYARQHCFLPQRVRDPFGNTTTVSYDAYDLLLLETRDALGNRVTAGERDPNDQLASQGNDYRVLQPRLVMDPNRNRSAVIFDVLGMVVGTAVMGKPEENLGDSLANFDPDLTDTVIASHLQDPLADPYSLLQHATTRLVYDLFAYQRTRNDSQPQPAVVYTLARETHDADLAPGQQSRIQHRFSYSDGFGREIQKKLQAEPGPLVENGPLSNPRWVGSGWTIFNNKGKPVRQYEPFFSATHHFEFAMAVGVSPILCYDPVERVVATLHPDHTYEKVVFDPWKQLTWDVNDTVLLDPKADPDVGAFFQRLPASDYLPTWYQLRTDPAYAGQAAQLWPDPAIRAAETDAANKTAVHASTPTAACFDSLGRPFLTIAYNRFERNGATVEEHYATTSVLDIQGNLRAVSDAHGRQPQANVRGRIVMRYDYDMLGSPIHQASMEAGERWMLNDVTGKPFRAWDSRGHQFRTAYDAQRRPTGRFVLGSNPQASDPRTLHGEVEYERTDYGEGQPNAQALNLRTRIYRQYDTAGIVTNMGHNTATNQDEAYDFKGNLLRSSRQLVEDYKALSDWSAAPPVLQSDIFQKSSRLDALNRPAFLTTPDQTIIALTYNEANLLESLAANLRDVGTTTGFITNIDYNARGQRVLIAYGNNTSTTYSYEPATFRLARLITTRQGVFPDQATVQDLAYIYDPSGNITHIQDDADIHNIIYFRNKRVEPSSDYTYDAIYRLVEAHGREHLGLTSAGQPRPSLPLSDNDAPRMENLLPSDGNAMGTYNQQYIYDEVGNILQMLHQETDPINPGWTRAYNYLETSPLETSRASNRLSSTQLSTDNLFQSYTYDHHGNMLTMPHLPLMQWDYKDQLQATQQQIVNTGGLPETTYYVYDASGQRVRKVTERQAAPGQTPTRMNERIYLGGFEIYRAYKGDGTTINLERETLHIMDDQQRLALVETRTQGSDSSPAQLTRYQFSNHLGTACLELDEQAQIITYEEYYPFGSTSYQAVRSQTETPKRYRYTGKERDEENGLYYHGARYYACWLGRWTACDPTSLSDGPNQYIYTHANPIVYVDSTGKQTSRAENELFRDLLISQEIWKEKPVHFVSGVLLKNEEKYLPALARFGYHGSEGWEWTGEANTVASGLRDFNRAAQAWYQAGGAQYLNTEVIGTDASGNFYQGTPIRNAIEALSRSVERSIRVGKAIGGANAGLGAIGYGIAGDKGAIIGDAIGGLLVAFGGVLQGKAYFQSLSSQAHGPSISISQEYFRWHQTSRAPSPRQLGGNTRAGFINEEIRTWELQRAGFSILGTQVPALSLNGSTYRIIRNAQRYIDVVAVSPGGRLVAFELKLGQSAYKPSQRAFDQNMESQGAHLRLFGEPLRLPTILIRTPRKPQP